MKVIIPAFALVLLVLVVDETSAECCGRMAHGFCYDCYKTGFGYCSRGGCNVFGCNCDGGCRSAPPGRRCRARDRGGIIHDFVCTCTFVDEPQSDEGSGSTDAEKIFSEFDRNGDGKISLKEFKAEKGKGAKEKDFNKVDSDGNGFVELNELDP